MQTSHLDAHQPTKPLTPKLITLLGIFCVVVGISWGFVDVATGFRFRFFTDYAGAFLINLAVGVLLSAGGTIAWARQFGRSTRLKTAGIVFLIGSVAFLITPNNVHGPGMLLGLAAVCALILSAVLAFWGLLSHNSR